MEVVTVSQKIEAIATVVQQRNAHRRHDLEQVENWDSHHYLQSQTLHLALLKHLVSQHEQANQHGFAVNHEKKILVHFAFEVSLLTHHACFDVNLIVGETVQNFQEVEQH